MTSGCLQVCGPIAITGGRGFIGSHVSMRLQSLGLDPIQLERTSPRPSKRSVRWNLEWGVDAMAEAIKEAKILIHLAGHIPSDLEDQSEVSNCLTLNTVGTANLLRAAQAAGVRQFIYASTAALYAPDTLVCKEDATLAPRRAIPYLSSKLAAELCVADASRAGRLICSILRLASVYGPGMSATGLVAGCAKQLKSSGAFVVSDGNRYRTDLVYVDDVAQAFVNAIGKSTSGTYNIGSGRRSSPHEVALCIADLLALAPSSVSIAPPHGTASPCIGTLDVSTARRELGLAPTPLPRGLELYLESLR